MTHLQGMTRYRKGGVYIVRHILETFKNKKILPYQEEFCQIDSYKTVTVTKLFCSCLSDRIPPDKAVCNQSPWGLIRISSYILRLMNIFFLSIRYCLMTFLDDLRFINFLQSYFFRHFRIIYQSQDQILRKKIE